MGVSMTDEECVGVRMTDEEKMAVLNMQIKLIFAVEFGALAGFIYFFSVMNSLEEMKFPFVVCVIAVTIITLIEFMLLALKRMHLSRKIAERQEFERNAYKELEQTPPEAVEKSPPEETEPSEPQEVEQSQPEETEPSVPKEPEQSAPEEAEESELGNA